MIIVLRSLSSDIGKCLSLKEAPTTSLWVLRKTNCMLNIYGNLRSLNHLRLVQRDKNDSGFYVHEIK